jgi:hypothetical protein
VVPHTARRRTVALLAAGLPTLFGGMAAPAHARPMTAGTTAAATAADAAAVRVHKDPLRVRIDSVTPSVIPGSGPVGVDGVVTNMSDSTWTDLDAYLVTSPEPMREESELAAAARSDPDEFIGERLITPGLYDVLPDLLPGTSTDFHLQVPRKDLHISGQQGVYWLAVHVLGADENGREEGADGRARTFIPLIDGSTHTSLAVMVQLRGRSPREADGRLATPVRMEHAFTAGRYERLLAFAESAGSFPLTWVVDPAVIDAARSLAQDNPPYGLRPSASPSAQPSDGSTDGSTGNQQGTSIERSASAKAAQAWLDRFRLLAEHQGVLTVPYADVDVAAAWRYRRGSMAADASRLSVRTLKAMSVSGTAVVDPIDGFLPWEAVTGTGQDLPIVLADTAVARPRGTRLDTTTGARITLTSTAAAAGGPGPGPSQDALATRQRILAEAALHALGPEGTDPLVVQLPPRWDPGTGWGQADLFTGLQVSWLRAVSAPGVLTDPPAEALADRSPRLRYPDASFNAEMPETSFRSAARLEHRGGVLDAVLSRNDTIGDMVAGYAYAGTSMQYRPHPGRAAVRLFAQDQTVRGLLGRVTVTAPSFVTMSGENGPFQVTVENGLSEPVTVGVRAKALGTDKLTIPATDPITIPAGQRRAVRMSASSQQIGVFPVVLRPTDAGGDPFGVSTQFKIRSSNVGQVIWAVLAAGAVLLLVAITVRVVRRGRRRRRSQGPLLRQVER